MDKLSCMKKSLFCKIGAAGANYVCFQEPKPTLKHVNLQCRDTKHAALDLEPFSMILHYITGDSLHCIALHCTELCSVVFYSRLATYAYYTILHYTISHYTLPSVVCTYHVALGLRTSRLGGRKAFPGALKGTRGVYFLGSPSI